MIPGASYLTIGLGIALGVSVLANVGLTHAYLGQRDTATEAKQSADSFKEAANLCSRGVAALESTARDRFAGAESRRAAAQASADAYQRQAQLLLQKRPSVPEDDCRSAAVQMDDWLTTRNPK